MKIWINYTNRIKRNCCHLDNEVPDLDYWRNRLFAGTIIYLLPFCLIGLVPSLYWIMITGQYVLATIDMLALISMLSIAFVPVIAINTRKFIFIACVYTFSCCMLYYIGLGGPGLIFLLTACVLCTLIFSSVYAWWSAFFNTFICILFIVGIHFHVLPLQYNAENVVGEWIAVTSNLVFLSFLCAALIPRLFMGLEQTILQEKKLRVQLNREQNLLKDAMAMLEHKNSELEQFAYSASHDLQEPLRMITGFLALLEKKYESVIDDNGKKYIHFAVDGAQRMRQIISDLLELSRAGRTDDQLEDVDVNDIVHEIKILYRKQVQEKKATIQSPPLPVIKVYKSQLKQVFQNLISNALKYSNEQSPVHINIDVTETATHWQFAITDNGIGIAEEYFDKIFVVFQRLHSNEKYSGSGMGLAICKKIIESMDGKIWVESKIGKGTVFYFTIIKHNNLTL
ncbi:MAG: ATP-binding protein [Ferruginibacter sp.]